MAATKGRIINISRHGNENISFLSITIGGVKRFSPDDFVELRPYIKEARPTANNSAMDAISALRDLVLSIDCTHIIYRGTVMVNLYESLNRAKNVLKLHQ